MFIFKLISYLVGAFFLICLIAASMIGGLALFLVFLAGLVLYGIVELIRGRK